MDKKRGFYNVLVSIAFKIIILILALLSKSFLIKFIGNEANGLYSLFISIIGILSVAELGIGTAISYCMYKPIVENEESKIIALYNYFKKAYKIVGTIILICGIAIMPFLPFLAKGTQVGIDLYISYIILLVSVVLSYCFTAKSALINAYKENYLETISSSMSLIIQYILQILFAIFIKSFKLFLLSNLIATLFHWGITNIISNKKHKNIIKAKPEKLDSELKKETVKNIKAVFIHKMGGAIYTSIDPIIISSIIGVQILGKYSNYSTIMTSIMSLLILFFSPLTSVVGHACAKCEKEKKEQYYNFFYCVNLILGFFAFLIFYGTIDSIIVMLFGKNLNLGKSIVMILAINGFIQFTRQANQLFKEATGLFYYDRWTPILESIVNVVLSIILGKIIGIKGVIIATIISNLIICNVVEIFIIYKHALKKNPIKQYLKHYAYILMFVLFVVIVDKVMIFEYGNIIVDALIEILVSSVIAIIPCCVIFATNKYFRKKLILFFKEIVCKINIIKKEIK